MARKEWIPSEEAKLIKNYNNMTIKELIELLGRDGGCINSKIKRLKKSGQIKGGKTQNTIDRSYKQRT